jgi:hypothetical protein
MSIHPKLAASRAVGVNEGTCFLLMPFAREMRPVHASIKEVCSSLGITCERADDIYSQNPIFSTILDSILTSEVIIADLTGKNPNVFYETGIAHSVREPQSVILASQSLDDVPFDLRHLPIVLYKLDNLQRFQIELENRIVHSRTATLGVNFAINYLFPLHFSAPDVKSFIDYANEVSSSFFSLIAQALKPSDPLANAHVNPSGIQELFRALTLVADANNGRWRRICDYLKLELLCSERLFEFTQQKCSAYLQKTTVSQYEIRERDEDLFTAELCFKLIDRDLAKTRAINWLLEYLHNPRMGNIDVVRYKIETFIVETVDKDIDAALLAMLGSSVASVRENVADMIGQKSIGNAAKCLVSTLCIEENPYTARSIITALARQNAVDAVQPIVQWVDRHHANWWEEPISITLRRVSEDTVRKLDQDGRSLARLQEILSLGKSENSE